MGTLTTSYIASNTGSLVIPVRELATRCIQRYHNQYTSGEWNPDATSNWAPGGYVDFTPLRADSRIVFTWRVPTAWSNASHSITHWRFYVNGVLYYRHGHGGTHVEDGNTLRWDVPSWGTGSGRIGYQVRSYANDNHETRLYTTYYWNGTGRSAQNAYGQLIVEEWAQSGLPAGADDTEGIVRAR